MRHWIVLVLFLLGLGTLRVVACGEEDPWCVDDEDCDDGDPCTWDSCIRSDPGDPGEWPTHCNVDRRPGCVNYGMEDGMECGPGKICIDGVCEEDPCAGVVCDDGLGCTDDECDWRDGKCDFTNRCNDDNDCTEDICRAPDGVCDFTVPVDDGALCGIAMEDTCRK